MSLFKPATKSQSRLRLALEGPSGSGKTYTALRMAHLLGRRIAVIDTENGSAAKYAGEAPDGIPWAFDVLDLTAPYSPDRYVAAIKDAAAAGYDVLVIDSMAHMWSGRGGMLDLVDSKGSNGNSFDGWRKCKPLERQFWDAIVSCRIHLIATLRSKTEWVIEDRNGKKVPVKIGTKADQRDGVEYEFDVALMLDEDHRASIIKTRCSAIDGAVWSKPGRDLVEPLAAWLSDGGPPVERAAVPPAAMHREPSGSDPVGSVVLNKAVTWLRGAGLLDAATTAHGDPETWSADTLDAIKEEARAALRKREADAAKTSADDAGTLLDMRRAKRVREATDAGVLDAIVTQYGEPMTWTHDTVNAIKADLAKLTEAA
mgnify:CR=1 FL=1